MFIECLSSSDGKEAIAKAANLLYSTCCNSDNKSEIAFTEADMTHALKAVGMFEKNAFILSILVLFFIFF